MTNKTTHWDAQCPHCGAQLNDHKIAVANNDKQQPSAGDIGMCAHCSELLEFTDGNTLIPLRDSIFQSLPPNMQAFLRRAQQTLQNSPAKESVWDM